jgi:hypothetical protein
MDNPLWMLAPWAVFAVVAAVKFWHITTLFRRHLLGVPSQTERARQLLERTWQRDEQTV